MFGQERLVPSTYRVIGRRQRRQDAGPRLTGRERYTADLSLPGMLHARLVLSRQAHAGIRGIDTSDALATPGVHSVITANDLPEFARNDEQTVREHAFLAHRRVNYVGQQLAVVLAHTPEAAREAADRVRIDYEPLPVVSGLEEALEDDSPRLRETLGSNASDQVVYERGDTKAALSAAAATAGGTFTSDGVYQSYMEPRAIVADADPFGALTIYTPTQGQFAVRQFVAGALRMPEADIVVQPMTVGGGFGAKFVLFEALIGLVALQVGQPVKLVLDRSDDFIATINAPRATYDVTIGADGDGNITAIEAEIRHDTGYYSHSPYQGVGTMIGSWYPAANLAIRSTEVYTNRPGAAAYRAPGLTMMAFVLEQLVDELAKKLGISPLDMRLKNASESGRPMADGSVWPDHELKRLLETAGRHPLLTAPKADGEGVGIAIGLMRGSTEPASATARLVGDGTLQVSVGSIDLTGTNSALGQIAAETFGVASDRIRVKTAPSNVAPHSGGTGGSKILYTVGNAVIRAAEDAKQQTLAVAAGEFEVAPDDLEIADGTVRVKGSPDQQLTLEQVFSLTTGMNARYGPIHGQGNAANIERAPGVTVHVVRVRVDPDTGRIDISGYAAIHDVGKAINPSEVDGPIQGGIAQGLGWALYESLLYDEQGQPLTASYMDYALPKAKDVPAIDIDVHEYPAAHGPYGAKGIGEPPVIPGAAAIANAINDATGVRLRHLPMTAERIWRAIQENAG
ncbi:MAG: xanthine dehydrogenase family protein molybdopterin-binding subunit [Thermomicrobiales bacterium]